MAADVVDEEQVETGIADAISESGRLDIVVSNAGINTLYHRARIDEFTRDEEDHLVQVDITGVHSISKFVSWDDFSKGHKGAF